MIKCSFCGNEITRDRFEFALEGRRQDFPPKGKWQRLVEVPREDVCPKCFELIVSYFRHILDNIRTNKGEYKTKKEIDDNE